MRRRSITVLFIFALAIGVVGHALAQTPEMLMASLGIKTINGKEEAPPFVLKDLQGREISLKDFRGKVILMNFWATWCVPCQWEMPEMEKLHQAFHDQGFAVVAIALDAEGAQTVGPFVKERKLTYPVLLDPELKAARQYRIMGPPTTFLIGREGELIGVALGPKEWAGEKAKALVRHLLQSSKKKQG
ncbi:MAG: TlpA family protein disulfide reductase [candidate division NC10 bacterium]|nr:TlpA family protein disulfide reductase [candidate division NC10 bacterium]